MGVVLAGGRGRRLGGAKATAPLGGRPLVVWPLGALREALGGRDAEVAVVARAGVPLPDGLDATVWLEPDEAERHPRTGLVHALERAGGRDVLVLAADLPLVPAGFLRALVRARALAAGQPLCGVYGPAALPVLRGAPPGEPLRASIARLGLAELEAPPGALLNVNTPQDLARAEATVRGG